MQRSVSLSSGCVALVVAVTRAHVEAAAAAAAVAAAMARRVRRVPWVSRCGNAVCCAMFPFDNDHLPRQALDNTQEKAEKRGDPLSRG